MDGCGLRCSISVAVSGVEDVAGVVVGWHNVCCCLACRVRFSWWGLWAASGKLFELESCGKCGA